MPNQTFFNLPLKKQDIVIQAAKKEFSRHPLHEASIANIIKDADIPRGSFYQYFDDKEDLYFYLLDQISEENHKRIIRLLTANNGDLFKTAIESFQVMILNHRNKEYKNFFKNTFLNMNYKVKNTLAHNMYEENQRNQHLAIARLINTTNLNIQDDKDLQHIVEIVASVTFHNLVQLFVKGLTNDEAFEVYLKQIELLKKGLYINGKNIEAPR